MEKAWKDDQQQLYIPTTRSCCRGRESIENKNQHGSSKTYHIYQHVQFRTVMFFGFSGERLKSTSILNCWMYKISLWHDISFTHKGALGRVPFANKQDFLPFAPFIHLQMTLLKAGPSRFNLIGDYMFIAKISLFVLVAQKDKKTDTHVKRQRDRKGLCVWSLGHFQWILFTLLCFHHVHCLPHYHQHTKSLFCWRDIAACPQLSVQPAARAGRWMRRESAEFDAIGSGLPSSAPSSS